MRYERGSYLKFAFPAGQATQITLACYWRRFSARTLRARGDEPGSGLRVRDREAHPIDDGVVFDVDVEPATGRRLATSELRELLKLRRSEVVGECLRRLGIVVRPDTAIDDPLTGAERRHADVDVIVGRVVTLRGLLDADLQRCAACFAGAESEAVAECVIRLVDVVSDRMERGQEARKCRTGMRRIGRRTQSASY